MTEQLQLEHFYPYRCARLAEQISQSMSRDYVDRFGISIAEWRILATLGEHAQMQARDIALHTNLDKVRVSRAVKLLVGKDYLHSEVMASDNRASMLSLSRDGRALYRQLVPQVLAWEESLLEPLNARERRAFDRILIKLDQRLAELTQ